jgi:hypothetical protein
MDITAYKGNTHYRVLNRRAYILSDSTCYVYLDLGSADCTLESCAAYLVAAMALQPTYGTIYTHFNLKWTLVAAWIVSGV